MQRRLVMCLRPVSIGNITLALIIFYDTSQHNGTYLEAMLVTPPFVKVAMRVCACVYKTSPAANYSFVKTKIFKLKSFHTSHLLA